MKPLSIIVLSVILLAVAPLLSAKDYANLKEAKNYCDSRPLSPIEGVWRFPEDNTLLLISADELNPDRYDITVVDSFNGSIPIGWKCGEAFRTPDFNIFKITFFARKKIMVKYNQSFVATVKEEGETLALKTKRFKLKFNFLSLIPYMGRLFYFSSSDPVKELPLGLYKVYPSYDHNGSSRFVKIKL